MSRSRTVGVIGMLLLAITQISCVVESEHPLIDPEKAQLDERLFGQWKMVDGDRTVHHFFGKPTGIMDCPAGLVVLHGATFSAKHEIDWDSQPMYGFAAKVGKEDYLHLIGGNAEAKKMTEWKRRTSSPTS